MSDVRQKSRILNAAVAADALQNLSAQFRQPFARQSRREDGAGTPLLAAFARCGDFRAFVPYVTLVLHYDSRPIFYLCQQFVIFSPILLGSIQNNQHQVRIGQHLHRFADSDRLRLIERMTNAGRIYESDRNATDRNRLGNQIPRGPRSRRHNGPFALHQPVEQRRLPHVRPADNRQRQSLMHDFSVRKAGAELSERLPYGSDVLENLLVRYHRNIVFREVDSRFEQSDQLDQLLLDRLQSSRQRSVQLLRRHLRLIQRLRFDQVAHRLSLSQIDAPVKKRPHRELPRLSHLRTRLHTHLHNVPQHDGRPVRRNLDDIVGSVRVRFREEGNDNLVDPPRLCRDGRLVRSSRAKLGCRVPHPCRVFLRQGGGFDFI